MTHQGDYNPSEKVTDLLAKNGWGAIPDLIRILNQPGHARRTSSLFASRGVRAYSRPERLCQRLQTQNGQNTSRGNHLFHTPGAGRWIFPLGSGKGSAERTSFDHDFSRDVRLHRAAGAGVQGVSTRRVKEITEQLCGFEISAEQFSRATAGVDTVLQERRERPLGEIRYLYLDARYEKVQDAAVLVVTGIDPDGERQVLGVSVSLSEHETHP